PVLVLKARTAHRASERGCPPRHGSPPGARGSGGEWLLSAGCRTGRSLPPTGDSLVQGGGDLHGFSFHGRPIRPPRSPRADLGSGSTADPTGSESHTTGLGRAHPTPGRCVMYSIRSSLATISGRSDAGACRPIVDTCRCMTSAR